jgi:cell wall-associated NlpC family hydrolase
MLNRFMARGLVVVVLLVTALALTASTPSTSTAKKRHSGKTIRKTSHSASNKRHSKFSAKHNRVAQKPLTTAEKAEIIGKIKSLASAEPLEEKTVTTTIPDSSAVAADIAQAAKEEREEDDIQVSLDKFIASRQGDSLDPETAKDLQDDYTLFDRTDPSIAATRSDIMQQIIDWVGTRYHFGGVARQGIDCSAFTREVFRRSFNVELPRTANEQSGLGKKVSKDELHFGDLVFFHTASYAPVSHVGIYVGDGLFANASCSRGVTVSSLDSKYWAKRYLFGKRLFTNTATAQNEIKQDLQLASNGGSSIDTQKQQTAN